jgi:hypothetical protein
MYILFLLGDFVAGLFICNCLPHLCAGLRGEAFPTPFAKPPGVGKSSAVTNTLWGTFNLIVGLALLDLCPFAGFVGMGVPLSRHFARVRGE